MTVTHLKPGQENAKARIAMAVVKEQYHSPILFFDAEHEPPIPIIVAAVALVHSALQLFCPPTLAYRRVLHGYGCSRHE
jgi:hypothetical protein